MLINIISCIVVFFGTITMDFDGGIYIFVYLLLADRCQIVNITNIKMRWEKLEPQTIYPLCEVLKNKRKVLNKNLYIISVTCILKIFSSIKWQHCLSHRKPSLSVIWPLV